MFGVVPKPIWSKRIAPDERNRIPQNTNCLLVELNDGRLGLVDTGCGDPAWYTEQDRDRSELDADWRLPAALEAHGASPEDVAFVVLTHLHWDHVGGTGRVNDEGEANLTFPNAQHFVHTMEWDDATSKNPLLGNSYPPDSLAALDLTKQDSLVQVADIAPDILPGIRMARSGGHTEGHCAVVLSDKNLQINHPDAARFAGVDTLVYAADVCPTQAHLQPLYQTSYDTFPLETRAWKIDALPEIAEQGYLLMFDHDPELFGATLRSDDKGNLVVAESLPVVP